ncbi:MAG: MopE-related protein [archaeon]
MKRVCSAIIIALVSIFSLSVVLAADADMDGYASDIDCDDNDAAVYPGAAELCDSQDNDCDASNDEGAVCGYNLAGDDPNCIDQDDVDDFNMHFGQSAAGDNGRYDFNGDGAIGLDDFFLLADNYGCDSDSDGVDNPEDNCPTDYNPDQVNSDSQGGGDVCDACPIDAADACDTAESVSATIGPEGGMLVTGSGYSSVIIPPGALAQDTSISISGGEVTPRTDLASLEQTHTVKSLIYTFGPHGTVFDSPVTISIGFDDEAIGGLVDIFYYNESTLDWEPQTAAVDSAAKAARLEVAHFSENAVACAAYQAYTNKDNDKDCVLKSEDNCEGVYNPDQEDTDGDGVGDHCNSDIDADGDDWADDLDNCPGASNRDQLNSDGDRKGDVCDNCPYVHNKDQSDLDGDDVGDACDPCTDADLDGYCLGPEDCDDNDGASYPGGTEVCDGSDNDCNNDTSDGLNEFWYYAATECGVGECARTGNLVCEGGQQTDSCVSGRPTPETCSGTDLDLDFDCDGCIGSFDSSCGGAENSDVFGIPVFNGCDDYDGGMPIDNDCDGCPNLLDSDCGGIEDLAAGECDDSRDNDCDGFADYSDPDCGGEEICNGQDDDGDGLIDEDLTVISGTDEGECRQGVTECIDGDTVVTQAKIGPAIEICDGLDNDCDGTADNGYPDFDSDGIASCVDNCVDKYNPDQINSDSQGGGDVCDDCPADATDTCIDRETITIPVGPGGGTVITGSGGLVVDISAFSLSTATPISITGHTVTSDSSTVIFHELTNLTAVSVIYTLAPVGITFSYPVTLTFKYDDAGIDESTVDVSYYNPATQAWEPQGAAVDSNADTAKLTVAHFSEYILGAYADADADDYNILADCDDNDASVSPGSFEIPGNSIDEDCDGTILCSPEEYRSHGKFVSCVSGEAELLLRAGLITGKEKGKIVSSAARSDIGKPQTAAKERAGLLSR